MSLGVNESVGKSELRIMNFEIFRNGTVSLIFYTLIYKLFCRICISSPGDVEVLFDLPTNMQTIVSTQRTEVYSWK